MYGQWIVLFACFIVFITASEDNDDENGVVKLGGVTIKGEKHSADLGYAYYGLRYARAERFQHAVLNSDYSYLTNPNRPKQGFICPQLSIPLPGFPPRILIQGEDCLYLDVYTPPRSDDEDDKKLPVLMWIHGGGYLIGDKDLYNATGLSAATKSIVVTINYRVGIFGFLSTNDESLPGNYGIGDAKKALQWVKENIDKFGGDKNAISIFGESAGGGVVSTLFLDDQVRGSVRAGLAMSGSAVAAWAIHRDPKKVVMELANASHCSLDDMNNLLTCLKQVPYDKLINISATLVSTPMMAFKYAPVKDGLHITADPSTVIANMNKLPKEGTFITGFLKEDSSLLHTLTDPHLFVPNASLNYEQAKTFLSQFLAPTTKCPQPNLSIAEKAMKYYNISESDDTATILRKLIHITTDANFGSPAIKESYLYANRTFAADVPNQLYRISYDPNFRNLGAFHGLDLVLLFGGPFQLLLGNSTMIEPVAFSNMQEMLRQVAYHGKISGEGFMTNGKYNEFGQDKHWTVHDDNFSDDIQFWSEIREFTCDKAVTL